LYRQVVPCGETDVPLSSNDADVHDCWMEKDTKRVEVTAKVEQEVDPEAGIYGIDQQSRSDSKHGDVEGYESASSPLAWLQERGRWGTLLYRTYRYGIESHGIQPVEPQLRTDPQISKIFFIWLAANFNILSFSAGTVGPVVYGLGLRDSCLCILFFNLLCCIPPAYLTTWGPKLGLRQMCQARYSFGFYGVIIPSILNCVTMGGFMILNCILGGQTLASVTDGRLSWTCVCSSTNPWSIELQVTV